jgi:hypothetical protein
MAYPLPLHGRPGIGPGLIWNSTRNGDFVMKKLLATFALAGLVSVAACAAEDEPEILEEPVIEQPAPAPIVTEPAPMMTDTMMADTMMMDTTGMAGDTAQ